jgi:hypothetical protein
MHVFAVLNLTCTAIRTCLLHDNRRAPHLHVHAAQMRYTTPEMHHNRHVLELAELGLEIHRVSWLHVGNLAARGISWAHVGYAGRT